MNHELNVKFMKNPIKSQRPQENSSNPNIHQDPMIPFGKFRSPWCWNMHTYIKPPKIAQ